MWPFKKKVEPPVKDKHKIVGVCLGWDMKPHICHESGDYYPTDIERKVYPEYFVFGDGVWPTDPITKEKLKIAIDY